MKLLTTMTVLMVLTLATAPAYAQGFYAGAAIGNTFFSSEFEDAADEVTKIDENSTAWKIFGGFNGHKFLGIEGGYRDFGTIKTDVGDYSLESKTKGWDIEALGKFEIAIVQVFGKAGVMFWSNDFNEGENTDGTDFFWGLGAGVALGPIGVRLEWESLEVGGPDNMSMVSLGATFGF